MERSRRHRKEAGAGGEGQDVLQEDKGDTAATSRVLRPPGFMETFQEPHALLGGAAQAPGTAVQLHESDQEQRSWTLPSGSQ